MHIGYDISQTGALKAGCGFYAHAMLSAFLDISKAHQVTTYPSFGDFYFDARMPFMNPYHHTRYGRKHFTRHQASRFWTSSRLETKLKSPDIIQSNNFWCPNQLQKARLIYTLHDLCFVANPAWTTAANRKGCLEGVTRAASHADWIIATSNATKNHYLETFPQYPAERIRVIYQCSRFSKQALVSSGSRPQTCEQLTSKHFWLSVGTIEPRKNQHNLLKAYARYRSQGGADMPLVLAGGNGWLMSDFKNAIDDLNLTPHVIMTGYLTDQEIIWLYQNCFANLYPSWFEGFGLPVLEGMQFGCPTLASNTTSLPEVVGEGGLLIAPDNIDGWTSQMLNLSRDPGLRQTLNQAALTQSQRFGWQKSASELLALYEEAYTLPKRT